MLTAAIAFAAMFAFMGSPPSAPLCDSTSVLISACATTDGTQVDVGASRGSQGSGGSSSSPGRGGASPGETGAPKGGASEPADEPDACALAGVCRGLYWVEVLPDVTAADLASFIPARPTFDAEPGGVGVVGMATNFVAAASPETQAGTLFDRPVTVRFVPSAYVFDHGDGTSGRSATGGASWSSLGQAQFTATPTSHSYRARGRYEASVTVEYAASVDFGTGWRPVIGTVRATAGARTVDVYEARTALVERTCLENPAGPGC